MLRGLPYAGALLAVRREVFAAIGGFDPAWDGTEEYDLALRLAERAGEGGFGHVADILYHRLTISGRSRRPAAAICADMPRIVQAHLDRQGIAAAAEQGVPAHTCRVRYRHDGPDPLVSIVVPSKNQLALLKRCVESVLQRTDYENYEVIVVDNGSDEPDACAYLQAIEDKYPEIGSRLRVLRHPGPFNFSAINNRAVREAARGEYICLLNNDAAPLDGAWLGEMMALARRPDIGAVGAKLTYPDGRIQHAGVILGIGWGAPADHPYIGEPGEAIGYWGRVLVPQEFSAVTAACCVTRRAVWDAVGGFDEENFAVAYNDVDYCLKVREAGFRVVWTPYARLLHEASASQRANTETKAVDARNARFAGLRLGVGALAGARLVQQPRVGGPDHAKTGLAHLQAVIDVVVGDREIFLVEPADRIPDRAPGDAARGGDGGKLLRHEQPAPIADRLAGLADIGMVGGRAPADSEDHPGMLYAAVGIGELGADGADIGSPRQRHHFAEPGAVERRGVVVEEADIFAPRRLPDGAVVDRRKIERAGVAQHPQAAADLGVFVLDRLEIGASIGLVAAVVDDDHLVILVVGTLQHALDAALQQRELVFARHHDRDQRVRPVVAITHPA